MQSVLFRDVGMVFEGTGASVGSVEAIRRVDKQIDAGEFVVILGPSGCGKSTLLSLVAGLEQPTTGEVLFRGRPITRPLDELSMVFQEDALFPWRTALGNIEFGLEVRGVNKSERRSRCRDVLELVGLTEFSHHYPRQLSGGMRQRVAIARALAVEPDVLLMDEPFGALDQQTRYYLGMELLRIWESTNKTVLFVTHDINEAVLLADRVWLMTPRPASIALDLPVDLPRPRSLETMATPRYHQFTDQLWQSLTDLTARGNLQEEISPDATQVPGSSL